MVAQDLERNPWKALLTMLGLVIGSAAVVAVTSVGLAGRDYAIQQLETLGSNFIWVSYNGPEDTSGEHAAGSRARELNEQDFQEIKANATTLSAVTRVVVLYTSIFQGGKNYPVSLVGADEQYAQVRNLTLDEGRALTLSDGQERRKVCLLARSLADKLYGRHTALARSVKIEDFSFDVIGVFRDVHTPGVQTEISRDAVLIPLTVARFFTNDTTLDTIYAQARSRELLDGAVAQIRRVLARNHGRGDLYAVNNLSYFVRVVHRISVGLMVVATALGAIALIVGGVGILNIMLISVSERTREIGMRRALGARRREIARLFFLEALVISLTGGVVGILLGSLGPLLTQAVFDFPMPVSLLSILIALSVSVGVGVSFGIGPALQAARMDPVVALRYE
jgi:putative ABC transport system permease protein